jgi:predicted dehydrogenase
MIKIENKIPIAVIGGGLNSAVGYAHFSAINLSNKFKIVAGSFSKSNETNKETSIVYGVSDEHLYSDYKTMLLSERTNIEVVLILTPNNQHIEQIIYAAELGIPIICEKALTTNYNEIERIKELGSNNFISVVFNYVCYPMLKELREIIKRGELGKITQVQIEMQQEGFLRLRDGKPTKPQDWRLLDGAVPTISLDLGSHTYSIVKFLTNETPLETIAIENSYGNFPNVVDDINSIIKYSNGVVCNMWYSKSALGSRNGLKVRVYGINGSAEWIQTEPEYLKMANNSGRIYILDRSSDSCSTASKLRYNRFKVGHPAGYIEALANFYEDASDDLENFKIGNDDRITFGMEESEECIMLLEAISKSAKKACWTKIK